MEKKMEQLRSAMSLLRELVENEGECSLDEDQNCQKHAFFSWGEEECVYARANKFLEDVQTR